MLTSVGTIVGSRNPNVWAGMACFGTPKCGGVFLAGSISWTGILSHNNDENNLSRITENDRRRLVDPQPVGRPADSSRGLASTHRASRKDLAPDPSAFESSEWQTGPVSRVTRHGRAAWLHARTPRHLTGLTPGLRHQGPRHQSASLPVAMAESVVRDHVKLVRGEWSRCDNLVALSGLRPGSPASLQPDARTSPILYCAARNRTTRSTTSTSPGRMNLELLQPLEYLGLRSLRNAATRSVTYGQDTVQRRR